ncbi:MAG: AbgT family transporter [Phycisphaerales bacterium]|nr:AbgT family transporter [Phycisphaerales bacterium]
MDTSASSLPSGGSQPPLPSTRPRGVLDWIEWLGNKLPEPALIFVILAALVMVVAAVGSAAGWKVQPVQPKYVMVDKVDAAGQPMKAPDGKVLQTKKLDEKGKPVKVLEPKGDPITPRSLLTSDGIYWMLSSMLRNFTGLPALGLIFVAMLGIGLAEKFGFFSALMRALAFITPAKLLTPMIVLLGANSSVASDAGYIILPPLAAALYLAVGRHPVAGLAAAFAGVAGGFGGGFFPTGGDGALTGFAQDAARVIDPNYTVDILHNFYFKAGSAVIVMFAGWFVTDWIVEPRLKRQQKAQPLTGDTSAMTDMALTPVEKSGLGYALATMFTVAAVFVALVLIPGAPLHGTGVPRLANDRVVAQQPITIVRGAEAVAAIPADRRLWAPDAAKDASGNKMPVEMAVAASGRPNMSEAPGDRWSHVIVPAIFLLFLLPGMAYGIRTGKLRTQADFVEGIYHGVKSIVPVLTISFFMGQFVAYFAYTGLDRMLAYAGGSLLVTADLPVPVLIVAFVLVVVFGDFALSGMLSKFGVMAPIFIPMFMMVGISPELTTAAYRIGDSVVNIVTPLNSYLLIILVVLQKYKKNAGLGSLISLMIPYSVVFFLIWTGFLLAWYATGTDLGPAAPLHYSPSAQ